MPSPVTIPLPLPPDSFDWAYPKTYVDDTWTQPKIRPVSPVALRKMFNPVRYVLSGHRYYAQSVPLKPVTWRRSRGAENLFGRYFLPCPAEIFHSLRLASAFLFSLVALADTKYCTCATIEEAAQNVCRSKIIIRVLVFVI